MVEYIYQFMCHRDAFSLKAVFNVLNKFLKIFIANDLFSIQSQRMLKINKSSSV